ncbi:MAG: TraM recognition domain-containing protein [Candidatus Paceibacterota bacterium]
MEKITFEGGPAANPKEEAERLIRAAEQAVEQTDKEQGRGGKAEMMPAATETVKRYLATEPETVLTPDYAAGGFEHLDLGLVPEDHDEQIVYFLNLLETRGIKHSLTALAKAGNPHLLDDFHRFLIQYIAKGHTVRGLKSGGDLAKSLHLALFEISLPTPAADDKTKQLKELISGMEQFYAGMISVSGEKGQAGWFSLEVANANGSDEFIFYVAVPADRRGLLEKQLLAVFPGANIAEQKDDYNIFNYNGAAVASVAEMEKPFLYPLKSYQNFDVDPLGGILSGFSKVDRHGEGAAIQLIVGPRADGLAAEGSRALDKIKQGAKIKEALDGIGRSFGRTLFKDIFQALVGSDKGDKEDKGGPAEVPDQSVIDLFNRKLASPLLTVNLRLVASAPTEVEAENILRDLESSFNQFEDGRGNRFRFRRLRGGKRKDLLKRFSFRRFTERDKIILNLDETTTILHFPAADVGQSAPQLKQAKAGTAPPPLDLPTEGVELGVNHYRGRDSRILLAPEDRLRHLYVIGQTGTGKTTLLKNLIIQDIIAGHGTCFIDPHGSDVLDILANIPPERHKDVIYFDPAATERPMALNMLEYDEQSPEQKTFVVNEMFSIFRKLYHDVPESMGPMFEQYFRNATALVIDDPASGSTLLDVSRVLANKEFRELKLSRCRNPIVVQFWREVAEAAGGEAALANIVPYITSKFDVFLANDIMRPIIAQQTSSFNLRQVMDEQKILLVNLSKGRLGDINSHLIGLILVGKILMAALSRADHLGDRPDFYLYLDEFQNITTDSIAVILSEARKYRLGLTMAHQFISQLDEKIRQAVFGNVGSMAIFRVGTTDAEFLAKQLAPVFGENDIANLDNYNAYVRLLTAGRPVKPFNIKIAPPGVGRPEQIAKLKELSALAFGRPRAEVEAEVLAKYASLKNK